MKVAFFAGLSTESGELNPVSMGSVIKFKNVMTNVGDAYDATNGKFKAPVGATYQFSVTISAKAASKAAFNVMKNTDQIMTVTSDNSNSSSSSASITTVAIFTLAQGDQVWIQLPSGASGVYGGVNTSFSGHILF